MMAKPIKETPVLTDNDASNFLSNLIGDVIDINSNNSNTSMFDVNTLLSKLDNFNINSSNRLCKKCGKCKPESDFFYWKDYDKSRLSNICFDCNDIHNAKYRLRKSIYDLIIDNNTIKHCEDANELLDNLSDCKKCRFNVFDNDVDYISLDPDFINEYCLCDKIKGHNCRKQYYYHKDKYDNIISETKSFANKICDELVTDDIIKIQAMLIKFKRKIKNYDASKH